ncbi:MAG: DivIVA domain-containing protein [Firmicutes bacterium]|nr:DivIVA domain-containing protein [Bacillota bacterium]MCL1953851.1 DivIVA domain-containing protein [Bacillota bacterium]
MFDIDSSGGYNISQVDVYCNDMQQKMQELETAKQEIQDLKRQLAVSQHSLLRYKQNNDNYQKSVLSAVGKAEEIEQLTLTKYQMELKQLRAFHNKWLSYYDKIISVYPVDSVLKKMEEFNSRMNTALNIDKTTNTTSYKRVGNDMLITGDNVQKSTETVGSQATQLDYKEALTPKQSLNDILKDLGIDK